MKAKNAISLKSKIIVLIVCVSILPMVVLAIMVSYNYNNIIKERFVSYAQGNMSHVTATINNELEGMQESVRYMLQDPTFNDVIVKQPNVEENSLEMFDLIRDIKSYLSTIVFGKKNYDVGGIFFYKTDQHVYYPKEVGLIDRNEIPVEEMANLARSSVKTQFYETYVDGQLNVYLTQLLLHKDSFKPIAMMYYRIDPEYLEHILENINIQSDESIYLYADEARVIASKGTVRNDHKILSEEFREKEPGLYIQTMDQEEYYIITDRIPTLNLSLITLVSSKMLMQDSEKIIRLGIILYLAMVPFFILMAYVLFRVILKPMRELTSKMKAFERGELDVKVPETRTDEFGVVYNAFNRMTQNINRLVSDVYVKELAKKDAEISALQEQINPHFLYNTLESINWRAQLAGEEEIALMIQALSKLMDASTNRSKRKVITVKEEVGYLNQYMYLIQMRYSDSLKYKQTIDASIQDALVPKLLLQPLIENAVKHGIEPIGEGCIELIGRRDGERLEFIVRDNGSGMDEEQYKKIQCMITEEKGIMDMKKGEGASVGLQNVFRRIQLIYGNDAKIWIESSQNEGTSIMISFPATLETMTE
ncbi:histidine kinase [Vallitaleaceae bacterium 9-2]